MADQRTLTERVQRLEQMLSLGGGEESQTNLHHAEETRGVLAAVRRSKEDMLERHIERAGTAPQPTSFEEIIGRIQSGTNRVLMIAETLEEIGNRILGALPEGVQAGGEEVRGPDGTLDHTFLTLNFLDHALCRLHAAAGRLERV